MLDASRAAAALVSHVEYALCTLLQLEKISPVWRLTVDSSQLTFVPTSKSSDTKTWPNIKNPARPNLDIVP